MNSNSPRNIASIPEESDEDRTPRNNRAQTNFDNNASFRNSSSNSKHCSTIFDYVTDLSVDEKVEIGTQRVRYTPNKTFSSLDQSSYKVKYKKISESDFKTNSIK